ncbi:MAG TPA: OmpP1/FadL family transporter [Bacteroidota bacterium]
MKINYLHLACTFFVLALAVSISFGGGYQINEHGARAVGMGGAFVARASDGSAMFFNPGGLAFQQGFRLELGTTLIMPSTTFTGPTPSTTETSMNSQTFFPSNFYASYSVGDKWVFGLGFFSPYGLGTEWPNDWVGRRAAVKTDLQTFYITPTAAYKVNDQLAFGLGLNIVLGSAKLSYRVPTYSTLAPPTPSTKDGTAALDGTGNGVAFTLGVLYKATDKLSVGASYRSLVKVKFSGTASFTDMQALQTWFPGGDGDVTLPMPSNFQLGLAYVVSPKLTLEGDFQWVGWKSYDQLQVNLTTGPNAPAGLGGQPLQKSPAPQVKNWDDGYLFRLGGEYTVNEKLTLRAGYIMDVSPQPPSKTEPMLPDGDRNDFSIGGGYQINEKLRVDLAYMLVLFNERDAKNAAFPGTYKSSANLLSLELGYQF